jgi:hypothetical protein
MIRALLILLLCGLAALAANVRLYLKDGTYQMVREYQLSGDRVRYYSIERSDWEEIPASLVDLQRTEAENKERQDALTKDAAEQAAEDKAERAEREERERVPVNPGVYLIDGTAIKSIALAESKSVTNKGRSVLKAMSPIPIVTGKVTVELDGEHSANIVSSARPEFYIRFAKEERFGIVRLEPTKKKSRIVQHWTIVPVTNELIEEQKDVPIFRKQVDEGLYKIWPEEPIEPGEYAVVEYTQGKGNVQTWDFGWRGSAK